MDYITKLNANRVSDHEFAAAAKASRRKRKSNRLTKRSKRGSLRVSAIAKSSPGSRKGKVKKESTEKRPMAKKKRKSRKGGRKSGRLTKQEIRRAGGLKQAWAARKRGKSRGKVKSPRRAAHTAKRKTRKSRRKSHAKVKHVRRRTVAVSKRVRKGRKRIKARVTTSRRKGGGTNFTVKVVGAAEKSRRRKSSGKRRKARANPRRRHHSPRQTRRRGALENPMTGVELFVGSVTGLFGFLTADAIDRALATHALTDKNNKDANGNELYADNPPTSGSYAGLFNATAVCAPMDAKRWIVGLLVAGTPITIAHFVSAPTGRAALQFFGFAAGVRIVGKALTDAVAILTRSNPVGQRLYDGEMRAAALKSGGNTNPILASLPSAGLGAPVLAAPCKCGTCAKCKPAGAGYPSMPREVTSAPGTQMQPPLGPPPPPPPPGPPPTVAPPVMRTLVGVSTRSNRFNWGDNAA